LRPRDRADGNRVIASRDDLEAALDSMARAHRMVFFAGLPGVGKSLFIRELARVAHAMGRTVHSLQWDVARPAFVSASFALSGSRWHRDPFVRKGVGAWVRRCELYRAHASSASLLIEKCR
jgi:adenylylsulfate kinase-like enzyme